MRHIQGAYPIQSSQQNNPKSLKLQNGSVVFATVHKHLGEGMAEVSIAGKKMIAKLETPLEAGGKYWFQIENSERSLELRLLTQRSQQSSVSQSMVQQLIEHFSLSKSVDIQSLVTRLLKMGLPIDKDKLVLAQEWLAQTNDKQLGLRILMGMFQKNIPFTSDIYQSLLAGKTPESLTDLLEQLTTKLKGFEDNPSASRVLAAIKNVTNPLHALIAEKLAAKVTMLLLDESVPFSTRLAALKNLQSLGILPDTANMSNGKKELASGIVSTLTQSSDKKIGQLISLLQDAQNATFINKSASSMFSSAIEEAMISFKNGNQLNETSVMKLLNTLLITAKQQSATPEFIERLFSSGVIKGTESLAMNYESHLQKLMAGTLEDNESRLFQQLHNRIESEMAKSLGGKEISHILKDIFQSLGVNLEARLSKSSGEIQQLESLKLYLIQMTKDFPTGEIKDIADKLLYKLNAQPLLSQQDSSVLTIVQQFPLFILGNKSDVSIQWKGKEKKDGTIDSNYCRILFYLELETLKETLIDMQVQNRIISINIWNEREELKNVAAAALPVLKANLEKVDYQLSSVVFKKPIEKEQLTRQLVTSNQPASYSGVDLKI
jgi:hypothetical protein